jgi:UDPglucose--hexose-1-phosphate uridylyltransferase
MTPSSVDSSYIRRTSTLLADGRELIYFDDDPDVGDRAGIADLRPPADPAVSGTMRWDRLTGEWVAIASHRQNRTFLPPADQCPLCPTGGGSVPSEVPAADYNVVVFENRFPSYSSQATDPGATEDPLFAS